MKPLNARQFKLLRDLNRRNLTIDQAMEVDNRILRSLYLRGLIFVRQHAIGINPLGRESLTLYSEATYGRGKSSGKPLSSTFHVKTKSNKA